ncbi:MAG: 3-hydroxyacyl-ACP dehydratase [Vicingaceae bacterium]
MLINDFFNLISIQKTEDSVISTIKLNAAHKIFDGHFPNNPVTPGVVQLQIVKELLEKGLDKTCLLKEVGRCKFLAILNPNETPDLLITINYTILEDGLVKVSASGGTLNNSQTFFKFTAKYAV